MMSNSELSAAGPSHDYDYVYQDAGNIINVLYSYSSLQSLFQFCFNCADEQTVMKVA